MKIKCNLESVKRTLSLLLFLVPMMVWGQAIPQQSKTPSSGATAGNQYFQWYSGAYTGYLIIPTWTNATANRQTPLNGQFGFQLSDSTGRVYYNGSWLPMGGGGSASSIYFSSTYFSGLGTFASPIGIIANSVFPTQTGNSGKFLTTDGTNTSWATVSSGAGTTLYTKDSTLNSNRHVGNNGHYLLIDSAYFNVTQPYTTPSGGIWFFGTSITAGTGANGGTRYSTIVANSLGLTEHNFGLSGATLEDRSPTNPFGTQNMIQSIPDIPTYVAGTTRWLVFEFGINDFIVGYTNYNPTNFQTDYTTVINAAIAKGWPANKIVMFEPTYANTVIYGRAGVPGGGTLVLGTYDSFRAAALAVSAAKGTRYITQYANLKNKGANYNIYNPDNSEAVQRNLHPNTNGHWLMAQDLLNSLADTVYRKGQTLAANQVSEFAHIKYNTKNALALTDKITMLGVDSVGNIGVTTSLPDSIYASGRLYLNGAVRQVGATLPSIGVDSTTILLKQDASLVSTYTPDGTIYGKLTVQDITGNMSLRTTYTAGHIDLYTNSIKTLSAHQNGSVWIGGATDAGFSGQGDVVLPGDGKVLGVAFGFFGSVTPFTNTGYTEIKNGYSAGRLNTYMANGVDNTSTLMSRMWNNGHLTLQQGGSYSDNGSTFQLTGTQTISQLYAGSAGVDSVVVHKSSGGLAVISPSAFTVSGANPTASIGFTAVNGSNPTYTRSDGAPKADSTVIRSVANSYSLAGLQTKLNGYVPTTTTLTGGNGINTIGDLSTNRTISADTSVLVSKTYAGRYVTTNSAGSLASLTLQANASPAYSQGRLFYDTGSQSLTFFNNDSNIGLQVGQEEWIQVVNNTGSSIPNGSAVYINGSSGGVATIALAQANAGTTTVCAGLTTETIANGGTGYVTTLGVVHGLNTNSFIVGAIYLDPTTPGAITQTAPSAPNYRYRIGFVTAVSATVGTIHVTPSTASLGNGTSNQVFGMNNAGTAQETKSIVGTAATGAVITNSANTITTSNDTTKLQTILNFFPKADTRYWTLGTTQTATAAKIINTSATGTTVTDRLTLGNSTAAANGAQQYSSALNLQGNGWGTTAGTSQSVNWRMYTVPVQSTVPTSNLMIDFSVAGGAYANRFQLGSNGAWSFNGGAGAGLGGSYTATVSNIAATSTDGLYTRNTQPATVGVPVQRSPRLRFTGTVWNTTATAATNQVDWTMEARGVSGTTPTSALWLSSSLVTGSTASYTDRFSFSDGGKLGLLNTPTTSAGTYDVLTRNTSTGEVEKVPSTNLSWITASADLTGQTAAVASIATYTVGASNGTFRVGGYLTITAVVTDVINFQVTWTDETSTVRTQTYSPMGTTSPSISTTGAYPFAPIEIRAKAATAITVQTVLTTGIGSITYDAGGTIQQLR